MRLPVVAIAALLCAAPMLALAHDKHVQVTPQDLDWFKGLRGKTGAQCCDGSDGMKIEDPDWKIVGDGYQVKLEGIWQDVPPDAVIEQNNRVGYAVVWRWGGQIRCFLPGASS